MSTPEQDEFARMPQSPYFVEREAAKFLRIGWSTLAGLRLKGKGPRYRLHGGRVAYFKDDLIAWSEQNVQGGSDVR